jgi:hypothetical protein
VHTCTSLLGVIYFQISEIVTKSLPLESCLKYRSLFVPRKGGSKFCPFNDPSIRSLCENSYNARRRRARETLFSGQKTIEEICITTGRSFAEVKGWIEEYDGKNKPETK